MRRNIAMAGSGEKKYLEKLVDETESWLILSSQAQVDCLN